MPALWKKVHLGSVVVLNPPAEGRVAPSTEVTFLPMAAVAVETGRIDPQLSRAYRDARHGLRPFREGDVLFAKITPSMENGKSAVARGLLAGLGLGSTEFHVLRPLPDIDADFLRYFISTQRFRGAARRHMTGTAGQLRVPSSYLAQVPIHLPPISQQRSLVSLVEQQLTRLESARDALSKVHAEIHEYRRAVLATAFPNEDAPDSRSVMLPSGWRWVTIGDISTRVTKGTTPTSLGFAFVPAGIRFVKAESLAGGFVSHARCAYIDKDTHEALARSRLAAGDVLFSIAGTLGRSAVVRDADLPANTNQAVAIVRLRNPGLASYVRYWLATPVVEEVVRRGRRGVGLFNLNLEQIRRLKVPLPKAQAEADSLIEYLDRVLSDVEALETEVEKAAARAPALREAVLGRLLVPSGDGSGGGPW